jgi:hypothetical protein
MVVELDLQGGIFEEFGRSRAPNLVHVVVSFPVEGDVLVPVGEV